MTEELMIAALESKIMDLEVIIHRLTAERDKAFYDRNIAQWAVVGVVSRNVHVHQAIDHASIAQSRDLEGLGDALGRQCAHMLVEEAGLAFKEHARLYEAECRLHMASGRMTRFDPALPSANTQAALFRAPWKQAA